MAVGDKHLVQIIGGPICHDLRQIASRLDTVLVAVEKRRRVHGASRVARWRKLIARLDKADPRQILASMVSPLQHGVWENEHSDEFRALIEARQFIVIVETLGARLSHRELGELLSGELHAAKDAAHAAARNMQFQHFVAAICERAGLQPHMKEPDVYVKDGDHALGIAVKRLRSRAQLEAALRDAVDQIQRTKLPGIVAIDVSRLVDPGAEAMTHWRIAPDTIGGALLTFQINHRIAFQRQRSDLVCGYLLYVGVPFVGPRFTFGTFEVWWPVQPPVIPIGDRLDHFLDRFARGATHPDVLLGT